MHSTAHYRCTICNHVVTEAGHSRPEGCQVITRDGTMCGCKAERDEMRVAHVPGLQYIAQHEDDDPSRPIDTDIYVGWAANVRAVMQRRGYKILPCVDNMAPIVREDGSEIGYYTVYDGGKAEAEIYRCLRRPCTCKPRTCNARGQMAAKQFVSTALALAGTAGLYMSRQGGR